MFHYLKFMNPLMDQIGEGGSGAGEGEEHVMTGLPDDVITQIVSGKMTYEDARTIHPLSTPDTFTPNPYWDIVKDVEGFKMPENITKENEIELIRPFIAQKFGITPGSGTQPDELHPLAKQVQELAKANPDITINDIISQTNAQFVDFKGMNDIQKVEFGLYDQYGKYDETTNPDGLTEEDVKEYISKLSKVQLKQEVKQVSDKADEYNKGVIEQYNQKQVEIFNNNYNNLVSTANGILDGMKPQIEKIESIFGINITKEENDSFFEEFRRAVVPDKESRSRLIDSMLDDDMLLYKLFVIGSKFGEEKIHGIITKGRETAKDDLFKKLGLTNSLAGSSRQQKSLLEMTDEERQKMVRGY